MEDWRTHPKYPGYEISADGVVASIERVKPSNLRNCTTRTYKRKILKQHATGGRNGRYMRVTLWDTINQKSIQVCVHILVLETFLGQRPVGSCGCVKFACHKDDDQTNNKLCNLYWGTWAENLKDKRINNNPASVIGVLDELGW